MKTCFKCNRFLPYSEFYKHKRMADGHLGKCKECTKNDVRTHRKNNDSVREYDRTRSKLPHRLAKNQTNTARYNAIYPERYVAKIAVNNAVRDGRLIKKPCQICGSIKSEGHHPDYTKPLEVIWLCPRHHKNLHLAIDKDESIRDLILNGI